MEIHQLRYFTAVAAEGNFSRAAERMHVAQPSLSQQIQKLEAEIGQSLFDRLPRGVALTPAGQKLLPYARRMLNDLADAQRCVDESEQAPCGALTFGVIPTIAPYTLHRLLPAAATRLPQVSLTVVEDVTEGLMRRLDDGELDVAIVSTCRDGAGLHRTPLAEESLLAVVPEHHPLARKKALGWNDLHDEHLLMLHETHCLSREITRWCKGHGVRSKAALTVLQLSTITALVAAGAGTSMLPAMACAREGQEGCSILPFAEGGPTREINAVRNPARYQSRALVCFIEVAREEIRKVVVEGERRQAICGEKKEKGGKLRRNSPPIGSAA